LEAFFGCSFDAWKNLNASGREKAYLGYSPVMCLDTEKIFGDFPHAHILHVVRNPYSGYADTKKRPFPLSLSRYTWTWNLCQHMALTYAERYPKNFHMLRFEDRPSWNGVALTEVYPWGTIRVPTPAVNVATMNQLSDADKADIKSLSIVMQRALGYENFWEGTASARAAA